MSKIKELGITKDLGVYTMAHGFYELWYKQHVSSNLSNSEKHDLANRISELTLKSPIWIDKKTNYIEQFPELKPYSTNQFISGLQLCAVMGAIVKELQQKGETL